MTRRSSAGPSSSTDSWPGASIASPATGRRLIGYWLGKEYWGKGIATRALAAFLGVVRERPLYAFVAVTNVASRRVLEKCGFAPCGPATVGRDGVEEVLLELLAGLQG